MKTLSALLMLVSRVAVLLAAAVFLAVAVVLLADVALAATSFGVNVLADVSTIGDQAFALVSVGASLFLAKILADAGSYSGSGE